MQQINRAADSTVRKITKVLVLGYSLHMHRVADLPLSFSDVNKVRSRLFRPLACQLSRSLSLSLSFYTPPPPLSLSRFLSLSLTQALVK